MALCETEANPPLLVLQHWLVAATVPEMPLELWLLLGRLKVYLRWMLAVGKAGISGGHRSEWGHLPGNALRQSHRQARSVQCAALGICLKGVTSVYLQLETSTRRLLGKLSASPAHSHLLRVLLSALTLSPLCCFVFLNSCYFLLVFFFCTKTPESDPCWLIPRSEALAPGLSS